MRCEAALQSEPRREGSLVQAYCLAWESFHDRVAELIICCLCVNEIFVFFMPVSGISVVCSVLPPVSCGVCATPLWLLVSPAASNLEPPLRWM
jgi:hypothetical protein